VVYYISSEIYHQTISSTLKENGELIGGQQVDNHIQFLKFIKANISKMADIDKLVIDFSALDDLDDEILQAIKMYRTMYDEARIIIIAPGRSPGDELLSQLFALGIWNIVATMDYLEIKQEFTVCLTEKGKSFKEALIFKDVKKNEQSITKEGIKAVNKVRIRILGSQLRIGVTHCSISLAGCLRKMGYLVAVLEFNHTGAFQRIRSGFDEKLHDHMYFTMNGIDYYPEVTSRSLPKVLEKNYNFIIFDFGNYSQGNLEEYHKCHVKIMIAGSKVWEIENLMDFTRLYHDDILSQISFCFNLTDQSHEKPLQKEMRLSDGSPMYVFFLKYNSDPFNTYEFPQIKTILKDYLPEGPPKKKGFWFRKNRLV